MALVLNGALRIVCAREMTSAAFMLLRLCNTFQEWCNEGYLLFDGSQEVSLGAGFCCGEVG